MKEYVCIYVKPSQPGKCLLILKSKPEWQKGKLNLVGGKIEPGETVQQAAKRELFEESGLEGDDFNIRGCLTGTKPYNPQLDSEGWRIWFLTCYGSDWKIESLEEEPVSWYWCDDAYSRPIVPNLKLIIPLLASDAPDWPITEVDGVLQYEPACWK